jgi:JmjC domain, hydroxylase
LEEYDIQHSIILQQPGQVVLTSPGSYLQGFNATDCFAETVNYARRWNMLDYARCNTECSIYYGHPDTWVPTNLAQSLNTHLHYEINRYELVSKASVAHAHAVISEAIVKDQKIGGQAAVSLTFFVTAIASSPVLKALEQSSGEGITRPLIFRPTENAGTHFSLLQRAHTYGFLGEVMRRVAAVGLYRVMEGAFYANRQLRSHKKGVKGNSKKKDQVLREVAEKILKEVEQPHLTTETIIAQITSTSKCGKVFNELAKRFGEPILMLFPDAGMISARNVEE